MEDRLRKFVRVAETMSFTRAARELHTSQPALSVAIRKLERELGATLIVRAHATFKLTPAGELAYAHAKELDIHASNFKLRLQNLAEQKPSVAVGMIDSIADALLVAGEQLEHFEKQVHMALSINNSRYLLQALERDELDIACVVSPRQTLSKKLSVGPLGTEPLIGVATPKRAAAARQKLTKAQLLPDFLAYDKPSHTNQLIEQYFAKRHVRLDTIFHSTSPEIILHMALAGRGSAVLPYALVAEHTDRGKLTPLTGVIARPIAAVWRTDKLLPPIIEEVRHSVKELLTAQNEAADSATHNL